MVFNETLELLSNNFAIMPFSKHQALVAAQLFYYKRKTGKQ